MLGEQLIGHYLATKGQPFTNSLVDIVAPLVHFDHFDNCDKYNLFYAIQGTLGFRFFETKKNLKKFLKFQNV